MCFYIINCNLLLVYYIKRQFYDDMVSTPIRDYGGTSIAIPELQVCVCGVFIDPGKNRVLYGK